MRVLIAGCGYVGSALGERLAADGHRVFGLRRRASELPRGIDPVCADLTDPRSLQALPAELDAVFYTAAADRRDPQAYRAAYVEGLERLLDAISRAQPLPRVLYASSTSVYGQDDGSWVDEDSPTEPRDFSGRSVLEGEQRLRASGAPGCAVRFGGIYGPGRTRLLERVRRGARYDARTSRFTNRVHRDDCAGSLRHLLSLDVLEPIWLAVDSEPALERSVLVWLAARLAAPEPQPEPAPATSRAAGAAGPAPPAAGKRCSNRRLVQSGYRLRYPTFREGYASLLDAAD